MTPVRITGIADGQVTPVTDTPVLSSANTPWSGFLLEVHTARVCRQDVWWSWDKTHVVLLTEGTCAFRVRGSAGDTQYVAQPGSVCIFPSGCEQTYFSVSDADFQSVVVELEALHLKQLLQDEDLGSQRALMPQLNIDDQQIAALLGSMRAEVEAQCPAGALYGQSLSLALAAYLAGRYSVKVPQQMETCERRLTAAQLRRVLDYIHVHLGSDLSLVDLAALVHLSPRHFSRLFRNTMGMTPYRYIVTERIKRAKILLANRQLSILEISETLGFASQSHFTSVFRKATGLPPRRHRQAH